MKKLFLLVMGLLLTIGSANAQAGMPEVSNGGAGEGPWYVIQVIGEDANRYNLCFTSYFDTQLAASPLAETVTDEIEGDKLGRYRISGAALNTANLDLQSWRILAAETTGSYKLQNKKTGRIMSYAIPDVPIGSDTKKEDILFLDNAPEKEAEFAILTTTAGATAPTGYFYMNATANSNVANKIYFHQSNEMGVSSTNYSIILTSSTWGKAGNSQFRFVEANGIWPSVGALDFGYVVNNETSDVQTLDVTKILTSLTGDLTYEVTGTGAAQFTVEAAEEWTAAAGGTLNVKFAPTEEGAAEATLVITCGSVSSKVSLAGVSTPAYPVVISPMVGHPQADANGDVWYRIQYPRSSYFLSTTGVGNLIDALPFAEDDAQLWKFTREEGDEEAEVCRMENKLGLKIGYTKTASFIAGTGGSQSRFLGAEDSDAIISFLNSTCVDFPGNQLYVLNVKSLTWSGGTLADRQFNKGRPPGFEDYNALNDNGNAMILHYASKKDIVNSPLPRFSAGDMSYWYTMKFNRTSSKYIQANGVDKALSQVETTEVAEAHLFKFVGTREDFKIVSYDGTECKFDGTTERIGSVAADGGGSFRFNGFQGGSLVEIYDNGSNAARGYFNETANAVGFWNGGDAGASLIIDLASEEFYGEWYQVQTKGNDDARADLAWTVEHDDAYNVDRVYGRTLATDGGLVGAQLWAKIDNGNGTYALKNRATGKYMDLTTEINATPHAIVTDDSTIEWTFTEDQVLETGYWRIQGSSSPRDNYVWLHQGNAGFEWNLLTEVSTWSTEGASNFKFTEFTTALTADEAAVDFGTVKTTAQPVSKNVLVSINKDVKGAAFAYELTGDAALTAALAETWNNAGGNIVITFDPATAGTYTATLKFSYDGINKEVSITAVAVAPVLVTGVTLDQTTATLLKGNEIQLVATVAPADAEDKSVTWSTNNEAVATVTQTGIVSAVEAGTATITVTTTDGDHTATCVVTVMPGEGLEVIESALINVEGGMLTVTNATVDAITIYNIQGVVVAKAEANEVYVGNLAKGAYIARIATANTTANVKFIVK